MSDLAIRPYRTADLDALYDICLRTGSAGRDATKLVEDGKLFGELFAAPYGILEPEHAFVIDDGTGNAIGYILGALDTRAFEARAEELWWPPLRARYPIVEGGTRVDDLLIHLIHHPVRAAREVAERYPSHLHIDLLPDAQGHGWGRRLMDVLLASFRSEGSGGVHLGMSTANKRARAFYDHLGFSELYADDSTFVLGQKL